MESQKIVNLLNDSSNYPSNFATKRWYIIDCESKENYTKENLINFITNSIESSLRDYSDITVEGGNANTKVGYKNFTWFKTCRTEINRIFDYIYIAMHMYNFNEYSGNYSDTSESLWQFNGDKIVII